MFVELDDHQLKAIDKLDNGKILWGGVGTGKSRTALGYFWKEILGGDFSDRGSHTKRCDLYIITTAKKRDSLDWQHECARFGIVRDDSVSAGNTRLVVDSWNNLDKYKDVEDAFFIFDEQRAVGSGQWAKSFIHVAKHNRWILLTATPGDTWLDYAPVFIANGFYKNRTDFKRQHVVYNHFAKFPKVDHYVETGRLVRHRNNLLVHMPYKRHTIRIEKDVLVEYDVDLFRRVMEERWHVYEERPLRDVSELFSVMRKVVNTDSSRLQVIRDLLNTHPRLIVFYNFDYELEILRTLNTRSGSSTTSDGSASETSRSTSEKLDGTPRSFDVAEWNGHKHEPIPETDSWVYLVQYQAGAEGWNCTETNAICFYSPTYSYKLHHQSKGRIDRLNTHYRELYYYMLLTDSYIDKAISKSLREKRSFNESAEVSRIGGI